MAVAVEEEKALRGEEGGVARLSQLAKVEEEHVLISVMASVMIYQACIILLSFVILVCFIWIRNCLCLPTSKVHVSLFSPLGREQEMGGNWRFHWDARGGEL